MSHTPLFGKAATEAKGDRHRRRMFQASDITAEGLKAGFRVKLV